MADSESTPLRPGSWREERATEAPGGPPPEQQQLQEGKSGGGVWWKVIIAILVIGAIGASVACGGDEDDSSIFDNETEGLGLCLYMLSKAEPLVDKGLSDDDFYLRWPKSSTYRW